jgi:hypothetical protein
MQGRGVHVDISACEEECRSQLYYGKDSRVATSSLSRAYQRLEDRQYIVRFGGRWKLTDSDPFDNGVMLGFMAWANNREFYALLGLKGPPLEWLSQMPSGEEPNQKGTQELAAPMKEASEGHQDRRPGVKTPLDQD